jgi:preprotein translocase subunit SecA
VKDRYQRELPEMMKYLEGQEREESIRAFVENQLRTELLQFERSVLLETLDSSWKDHLYAMDQLRDTINFRAISQQDPRTEYKREGSHQFATMMDGVKAKVTEFVFKARLAPTAPPPMMARPAGQAGLAGQNGPGAMSAIGTARTAMPGALPGGAAGSGGGPGGGIVGGGISGPGIG